MTLAPGTQLGAYEIVSLLGEGGMGQVYRARDTRLLRDVAIKILPESLQHDSAALARFEREWRAISALNHPNISTLYDAGPHYLVTELIEGETLCAVLLRPPAPARCLEIARQVLEALGAAHRAGIIHRDLKPSNIMVRHDGYVKLLDFGLVKRMVPSSLQATETGALRDDVSVSGQFIGTVAYMSPEQIVGAPVGPRSDLFSFGIILYEMLVGAHPWQQPSLVDTLHAILHDPPPAIDRATPMRAALAPIIQRLLCKDSAARFASAEAVLEALTREPTSSPTTPTCSEPLASIAVLPFVFLNDREEQRAFSLGFADALITVLGGLEDVAVLPTSAILNRAAGGDPAQTCGDLGVRYILHGSVQRLGKRWRVSTQLFDSLTHRSTLSQQHDCVAEDAFDVQDQIARRVMESLRSRLPRRPARSRDRYSADPQAFDEFIAGLAESYSDREPVLRSAATHLARALEHDPEFALAHAIYAYVAMQFYWEFESERAWLDKAEYHCGRALALDPTLPEGHSTKAFILWSPAKNFQHADAIAALGEVLAAQPNNERAHNRMASICMHIGRLDDARIAHQRAVRSNPKTRSNNLAFLDLFSGDFASAEASGNAWIREQPDARYALWYHPLPALMMGDLDEAERRLSEGLRRLPHEPLLISVQGMLHARRNQSAAALQCVHQAQESPHSFGHAHHTDYQIASVYATLGDADKAILWLQRSADAGNPCWPFFKIDPHLENLRGDRRFQTLVAMLERKYSALQIDRL